METQIIKIDGLAISKQSVESVRQEIAQKVIDGEIDPIKVMASVKFYQKVFEGDDKKNNGLTHLIKNYVVDDLQKDPSRKDYFGFKVEVGETGVNYNFSNCNDEELKDLLEAEKELKEKIKDRQDFLKTIKGHLDIITSNGEAVKIFPPAKFSSTSAKFTLK